MPKSRSQKALVTFLDNTEREYEIPSDSLGDVLFQQASIEHSLEEDGYFALSYYDENSERHWLYLDKKIAEQMKGLPWVFSFCVKYFPLEVEKISDSAARHLFYLKLKHDIYTGSLFVPPTLLPRLASYCALLEIGDVIPTLPADLPAYSTQLTAKSILPQRQADKIADQVARMHVELISIGLTSLEAEAHFLEVCQKLPMYGIALFPAKDSAKTNVSIGIGASGITIHRDAAPCEAFKWQCISKVSYRKRHFTIKTRSGIHDTSQKYTYKLTDYLHAKRVWKCAVETHTFYRVENTARRLNISWPVDVQTSVDTTGMCSPVFESPCYATIDKNRRKSYSAVRDSSTLTTPKPQCVDVRVTFTPPLQKEALVDYDAELNIAILTATKLNPDLTVAKIDIQQQ